MSVERPFEAWEEVQRQGLDLADRLTQGFSGLLQMNVNPTKIIIPFDHLDPWDAVSDVGAVFDIGNRLGKASAEIGASFSGLAQEVFSRVPVPFHGGSKGFGVGENRREEDDRGERVFGDHWGGFLGSVTGLEVEEDFKEEDLAGLDGDPKGPFGRLQPSQGSISVTSTYDSRNHDIESSLIARGDLWRAEASYGRSVAGNDQSSLYLLQLGPVLLVRDTTLLLPVHLSKQHLLWYGYDRKNGVHSLCPAIWSKHRRWLTMSMISLNPLSCSFLDLQFPNGQLTYVAGEGFTTSTFLPILGGLLQLQGQYPGETKFSFSCKNKWGTRITPVVQWPDKSFTLGIAQALAWQRSGLLVKPTFQLSISPTIGGSNPGLRTELIHTLKEQVSLICGCAYTQNPSAYASISVGRSKWNGNVGSSGVVIRVETPLSSIGRPSFSVQVNSGIEF